MTLITFTHNITYKTTILVSDVENGHVFDDSYIVYLENNQMVLVSIEYDENLETYKVEAEFKRAGKTNLILEDKNGNKTIYEIDVKRNDYDIVKK